MDWELEELDDDELDDDELEALDALEADDDQGGHGFLWAAAAVGAFVALRAAMRNARAISLRNRSVIITGGSRGLGLVLARELIDQGARVAICARDPEELERAAADLEERGGEVVALVCDVTDQRQVEAMVRTVRERFGGVDVLINNAGVIQVGPSEQMELDDYEDAMRTHFWGPLYATKAVLPLMRARGAGRIVNISSIGGKISVPHLLPYSASKFALVGLSEGLRSALARENIVVTTVCPGLMRTGSPRHARIKGQHRAEYAWFSVADSLPLLSASAERAARRIVDALRHGDAEVVLPGLAWLQVKLHGLFPGLAADAAALLERALPAPSGDDDGFVAHSGAESASEWSESALTRSTAEAAERNNEMEM